MRLAILTLLVGAAAGQDTLDQHRISKDAAVAVRVAAALALEKAPLSDVVEKLGPGDTLEDRDIGFGARRVRMLLSGGYTRTRITLVAWKNHVGPLEVTCLTGHEGAWGALRERVAKAYAPYRPTALPNGLRVQLGDKAGPRGFHKARSAALGGPLAMEPHPDLAKQYTWLWSPLSDVYYGLKKGYGGSPPRAREAVEVILAHRHGAPVLRDLLCCPNPESRVYAAEALLRLEREGEKLPEGTQRAIDWVRKSDVRIHVARGCELTWEPAKRALGEILKRAK
jgi:hypothetical protein